jgi:serine beta-lactamase-like protein LACTB, mitochondrial
MAYYRIRRVAALLALVALTAVSVGAQQQAGLPADKLEKIEKAITAQMARQAIPGLSAAVVVDHKLRWSNGYGLADVENFVPSKAMTAYRLASISKPITATAVMQLVERGKLDLDAPIQSTARRFPENNGPSQRGSCSAT